MLICKKVEKRVIWVKSEDLKTGETELLFSNISVESLDYFLRINPVSKIYFRVNYGGSYHNMVRMPGGKIFPEIKFYPLTIRNNGRGITTKKVYIY